MALQWPEIDTNWLSAPQRSNALRFLQSKSLCPWPRLVQSEIVVYRFEWAFFFCFFIYWFFFGWACPQTRCLCTLFFVVEPPPPRPIGPRVSSNVTTFSCSLFLDGREFGGDKALNVCHFYCTWQGVLGWLAFKTCGFCCSYTWHLPFCWNCLLLWEPFVACKKKKKKKLGESHVYETRMNIRQVFFFVRNDRSTTFIQHSLRL